MQALHGYMLEVGLDQVPLANGYDVEGDESQIPEAHNSASPWMAFAFSDPAQSTHPIYISFRIMCGSIGTTRTDTNYWRRFPQYRVSTDIDPDTGAASENVLLSPGVGGSSYNYGNSFNNSANKGDFIRYTGDALTILFGVGAMRSSYLGDRDLILLHVERQQQKDGSFSGGPAIVMHRAPFTTYNSSEMIATIYWGVDGSGLEGSKDTAKRVGDGLAYYRRGVASIAPIFYKSHDRDELLPFRYMFSAPFAPLHGQGLVTLNFEGAEKQYVRAFHEFGTDGAAQFRIGYIDQCALFSWDD